MHFIIHYPIGEEMFVLLSLPDMYPYGYIVALAVLAVSIILFAAFPRARKYILIGAAVIGLFQILGAFLQSGEGISIGFLTLTCVGIMATFQFSDDDTTSRILVGLSFAALGAFLLFEAFDRLSKGNFRFMTTFMNWISLVSWASITLAGSVLIIIAAFRKRYAIRTKEAAEE